MTGKFAVEQLLTVFVNQRAVLGNKGDLVADFREKRDQLVVLVAAADNEFNTLLLELRKLLEAKGRGVRIRSIAPQVRKLFNLTQLAELFGLPE